MTTLIIIIHVIACVVLIGLVLIQRGRGSGLVETLSGVESIFGTKTSAMMTRLTTIFSVVFFLTCLSLAVLSVRQSRSLMRNIKTEAPAAATAGEKAAPAAPAKQETPAQQNTSQQQAPKESPKVE